MKSNLPAFQCNGHTSLIQRDHRSCSSLEARHLIESVKPHYVFLFKELMMTSQDRVTGQVAIATLLCKQQAKTQWHLLPSLASSTTHSCLSSMLQLLHCFQMAPNSVFLFTLGLKTQYMFEKRSKII